ncbi:MAG: isopentenyl phosphate kinase [Methanothrix sp.]|nr:isopentenyl phosphate kinase [Methanothrix sp.]
MTKVLKIGGSILTDKTKPAAARPAEIQRIAKEIASSVEDLVLVHGAGSFGHISAKRYGLPQKFSPEGLRVTHNSVVKLNDLMVEALGKAGVSPMPVHPFSCTLLRDGRIEGFALEPVKEMIRDDLLPVLHGDVAMDINRKAGIVSGDQLVAYLAWALRAEIVAVGTNVDGVLISGRPLKDLTRKDLPPLERGIGDSSGVDVTGGMRGKLLELLDLADEGIESVIFNAAKEGNIAGALKGESAGTKVRRAN